MHKYRQACDREVSRIAYVEIVSERADCKSTLMGVIGRLQNIFVEKYRQKYVLVVGDAKTYNILQSIRFEYRSVLKWLIPDWHILYNYQKVLMKPYADAGLVTLEKVSGHRAETLTSLIQANNFRRTHEFLLQAFDAFYRYFISLYSSHIMTESEVTENVEERMSGIMSTLIDQFSNITSNADLDSFRDNFTTMADLMPLKLTGFIHYMEKLSHVRFWYQFVSVDCFAYITLFTLSKLGVAHRGP